MKREHRDKYPTRLESQTNKGEFHEKREEEKKLKEKMRTDEMRGEETGEETDVIPFSGCCCFGRTLVLLGCVEFCPRVTVTLCTSVLPTG